MFVKEVILVELVVIVLVLIYSKKIRRIIGVLREYIYVLKYIILIMGYIILEFVKDLI